MFRALPHAFLFELFQLAISLLASWFTVLNYQDSHKDLAAVKEKKQGVLIPNARRNLINARYTVGIGFLMIVMNIVQVLNPPPPPHAYFFGFSTESSIVIIIETLTFGVTILLLLQAVTRWILRHRRNRAI